MKKGILIILLCILYSGIASSAKLTSINFVQEGDVSIIEMSFDEAKVKGNKFHISEDKQLIVDLKNVSASKRVMRAFDTSEFSGSIIFVDAYPKPGSAKDLRITLQMRENVRSILILKEKKIVLEVENHFGAFTQRKLEKSEKSFTTDLEGEGKNRLLIPKSDSVEDILENLTLSGRKKYIGQRISFNFRDVPVEDVLHMIANASGFNIIINKSIKDLQTLSLALTNIPWDQALDTILGLNKLVASKNGNILLVTTLVDATKEREQEIKAKQVAEAQEPLVTKIFPISYAKLVDMEKILKDYLTPTRGTISLDERTNSFIVKDKIEVIEKLKRVVEVLDAQTPQILIESKIVEVSEDYSKIIGLQNGVNFGYDPIGTRSGSNSPVNTTTASGADFGPGFSMSSAAMGADGNVGRFLGVNIGQFGRLFNLNFALQLLETESKGKIVASPKVITQNKQKAVIKAVDQTNYAVTTVTGDTTTTDWESVDAALGLEVTPQVTNEGSIVLDVVVNKDQLLPGADPTAPPNKNTREIKTTVLVENGSTIVLGGIYNFQKMESKSGVPFLQDIPLLGWLFRSPENPRISKKELIIFITPRIINQEEAGLVDRG